jgi:hypothetical protein
MLRTSIQVRTGIVTFLRSERSTTGFALTLWRPNYKMRSAGLVRRIATDRVVLDMDSSESAVHGQQEGSAYNGHFRDGVLSLAVPVQ